MALGGGDEHTHVCRQDPSSSEWGARQGDLQAKIVRPTWACRAPRIVESPLRCIMRWRKRHVAMFELGAVWAGVGLFYTVRISLPIPYSRFATADASETHTTNLPDKVDEVPSWGKQFLARFLHRFRLGAWPLADAADHYFECSCYAVWGECLLMRVAAQVGVPKLPRHKIGGNVKRARSTTDAASGRPMWHMSFGVANRNQCAQGLSDLAGG